VQAEFVGCSRTSRAIPTFDNLLLSDDESMATATPSLADDHPDDGTSEGGNEEAEGKSHSYLSSHFTNMHNAFTGDEVMPCEPYYYLLKQSKTSMAHDWTIYPKEVHDLEPTHDSFYR
jgi:hypothetical protein